MTRNPSARNIVLIGARGSGKTCVGRELASVLGWRRLDTDDEIERRAGRTIAELFTRDGEARFRAIEQAVISDISASQASGVVVSAGGGAVLNADNRQALKTIGVCVWLVAGSETLHRRVANDPISPTRRPSLGAGSLHLEIEQVLRARAPLYGDLADLVIDTERAGPEDVAREIATRLGLRQHGTANG